MHNEAVLGYMAGIIDGEGSVELKINKPTAGHSLNLVLHVFNSDRPLMDWMQLNFGGKVYDIHRRARVEKPQWQPVYIWNLTSTAARDLLEILAPYMVVKRSQAELAVYAWDNRKAHYRGNGPGRVRRVVPDEVKAERLAFKNQMHLLNRKNRGQAS